MNPLLDLPFWRRRADDKAVQFECGAGFQPAVSPISNRQSVATLGRLGSFGTSAGWKHCDTAGLETCATTISIAATPRVNETLTLICFIACLLMSSPKQLTFAAEPDPRMVAPPR